MSFVRNTKTLLTNPVIARDYLGYLGSKIWNSGRAIRTLADGTKISDLNGFSEYHSIGEFVAEKERQFFAMYSPGPGVIIDVGANLGVVSCLFAKRFPDRTVHAFEPSPATFPALKANIDRNGCRNIQARQVAVADRDGEISFDAHPIGRATASISTSGQHVTRVPCITLDTFAEQHSIHEIALLKIDVEGFEAAVLQGAQRILSQRKAVLIYYEVCPGNSRNSGVDPKIPTRILLENGYTTYKIDEDGSLIPSQISEVSGVVQDNWVAIAA